MTVWTPEEIYHHVAPQTYTFAGHAHKTGYEATAVLSGTLEITHGDTAFLLCAGDMMVYKATVFHRNRVVSAHSTELISVHLLTDHEPKALQQFFTLSSTDMALLRAMAEECDAHGNRPSEATDLICRALLMRVSHRTTPPDTATTPLALVYREAVRYMTAQLDRPLSVSAIATQCHVCPSTLQKAFASYTGQGVAQYLFELRMTAARELLISGKSAKEVAALLGFSSPSYFSQCFRRRYSMSLRQFFSTTR